MESVTAYEDLMRLAKSGAFRGLVPAGYAMEVTSRNGLICRWVLVRTPYLLQFWAKFIDSSLKAATLDQSMFLVHEEGVLIVRL